MERDVRNVPLEEPHPIHFEGSHRIEYNGMERVLVFIIEHIFDLGNRFPYDNTPFLVDSDGTLIIPKASNHSGFVVCSCLGFVAISACASQLKVC